MNAVEWSKKEEIVGDQALKYLKQYTTVLQPFTSSGKAELSLLNKVQEYCYDNMNFMKVFQKIVMLFYKCKFTNDFIIAVAKLNIVCLKLKHPLFNVKFSKIKNVNELFKSHLVKKCECVKYINLYL